MTDYREAKAQAKAEKARAKSMRPWFKKTRFVLPLGFVVLIVIIGAAGGGSEDNTTDKASQTTEPTFASDAASNTTVAAAATKLYPGRPDSHKEDQEQTVGGEVRLSGYTAKVSSAGFSQSLSTFEDNGYLKVSVAILNRDDKAQSYNLYDWKLQTPAGQVIDPTFSSQKDELGSGDLVSGGEVTGMVYFEVGATKGQYYIVYKPDPFDAARGIWGVTL